MLFMHLAFDFIDKSSVQKVGELFFLCKKAISKAKAKY